MPHYGLLRHGTIYNTAEDIRGATLYGLNDEKLGKIDDVIFEHSSGDIHYIVVDAGGWLTTKKFIVSADHLQASTKHEGDFTSDLTKQQVEGFPPYAEKDVDSEERWTEYEARYRSKWETGAVMHRAGTDRNVTPTTQQLEGNRSSTRAEERASERGTPGSETSASGALGRGVRSDAAEGDLKAASLPTGRVVPAGADSVVISSSASGIGPRWDTFQDRLRERRREAIAGCGTCSVDSSTLKKAG